MRKKQYWKKEKKILTFFKLERNPCRKFESSFIQSYDYINEKGILIIILMILYHHYHHSWRQWTANRELSNVYNWMAKKMSKKCPSYLVRGFARRSSITRVTRGNDSYFPDRISPWSGSRLVRFYLYPYFLAPSTSSSFAFSSNLLSSFLSAQLPSQVFGLRRFVLCGR